MPQGMKRAEDAQGIKCLGEAKDVIWTDLASILDNVN